MIGLYHTMTQHPHPRKLSTSGSKMKNNVTQKTPIDHQRLHEYPSTVILAEFLTYLIIKRSNKVKKIILIFCLCQANICFICKYIRANTGIIRFIRIRAKNSFTALRSDLFEFGMACSENKKAACVNRVNYLIDY